ncbi:MAG: sortase [Fastidiosipilaceae bacterium]|jgi:sortase A
MRAKLGTGLMILGTALICVALSLFLYNRWEDNAAGEAAAEILGQLQNVLEQESDTPVDPREETDSIPDPYDKEMTVQMIDGYGYIGYLSIPELGLELPVMSEWDYSRLKIAPCRYSGSTKSHDLVIAAHNYIYHFGRLKTLNIGDPVLFRDMDDVQTVYKVTVIEILGPTNVLPMMESEHDLTLFTCTIGGASRVTVRCDLVE